MSDQDMQDIAAYLVGQELKPTGKAVGTAPKAAQTCVACHGATASASCPSTRTSPASTRTTSQNSLQAYRSGQRKNPVMAGMAAALTDPDIRELAALLLEPAPGPVRDQRDPRRAASARRCKRRRTEPLQHRRPGVPRPSCFRAPDAAR